VSGVATKKRAAHRAWVFAFVAAVTTWTGSARADFPSDCPGLGDALVSHSCFHARYGPYRTVSAVPLADAASAPRVDGVHTHYEVVLTNPGAANVVTYQVAGAARAGAWAFFHEGTMPFRVETLAGAPLSPVHSQRVSTCGFLPKVDVYQLGVERVRLVFGPTSVTRTVLVAENVDDFVIENGRDADGDGYGSDVAPITSFCFPPAGYVQNTSDCNDGDDQVHPAARELCDGVDQNCNGIPDDVGLPCTAGAGACARDGVSVCDAAGAPARCSATPGPALAETCDGKDTNCDGKDDLDTPQLCTDALAPRCIVDEGAVRCGCTSDADCGSTTSGRVCDLDTKRCVVGCVDLAGRNGCPPGARCSSADPNRPGTCEVPCVPACGAGTTCREGVCVPNAPAPDAGPAPADGGTTSPAPEPEPAAGDPGGCTCDTSRASTTSLGAWGALVLVTAFGLRRRVRA